MRERGEVRARGLRFAAAAATAAAGASLWAAAAIGAPGDLTYLGCVSAEAETTTPPAGNGACDAAGPTSPSGSNSGFDNARATVVSPDGRHLYGTASNDSSVVQFARDPATGALSYLGCISGETESASCTPVPVASAGGDNTGLGGAQAIGISPDGASVYVAAANDSAVARFSRDPAIGTLTYQDCITGEVESGPSPGGSGACSPGPPLQAGGANTGLQFPHSIAVANNSVYVAARGDDAVARFSRDPSSGALTYEACFSGEAETTGCAQPAGATSGGGDSGLDFLQGVALSPDGTSLYAATQFDSAVVRFDRDNGTGVLTYQGCITGEQESGAPAPPPGSGACEEIPSATVGGDNSGMLNIYAVAVSPDGSSVFAVSENDDSLVRFDRALGGGLAYQGCISGKTEAGPACELIASAAPNGTNSGLDKLRALLVNPDGNSVYVAVPQDDAVSRFARDRATGSVAYAGCFTGEAQSAGACTAIPSVTPNGASSGLDNPQALAISPASTLYVGAANDAGIALFDVEPEPDTDPPETTIVKGPKRKTKKRKAKFKFASDEPGSTFACKLDKKDFKPCDPSEKFKVKRRKHKLKVAATDPAGNTDPTPAKRKWKVKKDQ